MNFEKAKEVKAKLEKFVAEDSAAIHEITKGHKLPNGLTPDHIKFSPEYRNAKSLYHRHFSDLRRFNQWYVKTFKKELAEERKNRLPK